MNSKNPSKLVGLGGLASSLKLSCSWLKQEAEAGRIPCLKAGDVLLFDRAAVEQTLLKRATTGGSHED